MTAPDRTCKKLGDAGCTNTGGAGNSSECAYHPSCPEHHLAEDLAKVKVLCAMNKTHQRYGPVEMRHRGTIIAQRDLLFICPECENSVRIVFQPPQDETPSEPTSKGDEGHSGSEKNSAHPSSPDRESSEELGEEKTAVSILTNLLAKNTGYPRAVYTPKEDSG